MDFVAGQSIETLESVPQDVLDRQTTALIELVLRQLFEFEVMQMRPAWRRRQFPSVRA